MSEKIVKFYESLKKIAKGYQTPKQIRRSCGDDYGLDYAEALEMAYENIQAEAARAIRGVRVKSLGGADLKALRAENAELKKRLGDVKRVGNLVIPIDSTEPNYVRLMSLLNDAPQGDGGPVQLKGTGTPMTPEGADRLKRVVKASNKQAALDSKVDPGVLDQTYEAEPGERSVSPCLYSFEEVEIFLRVRGRLPFEADDGLTQEILDRYCEMYDRHELTEGLVPLDYLYHLIKSGKIGPSELKTQDKEEPNV